MKRRASTLALTAATLFGAAMSTGHAAMAEQPTLDGILIIRIDDDAGKKALGSGDYIVTFVSDRGSYGAVVAGMRGTHAGCQSLGNADSYTGRSISFGIAAGLEARRPRQQTYCAPFKVTLQNEDTALIEAETGFNRSVVDRMRGKKAPDKKWIAFRQKIVAHVPLVDIDFAGPEFANNDIKGTPLGPVTDDRHLHRLGAAGYGDRSKAFQRQPEGTSRAQAVIRGHAAASEITGWPWDVLYSIQHFSKLDQLSTRETFRQAVEERYGKPSAIQDATGYSLWIYDLDGKKLDLGARSDGSCRNTADLWIEYDRSGVARNVNWGSTEGDLGPWGCSVLLELRPNSASGGVPSYAVRAVSGYVMAINHFLQQVTRTRELRKKIDQLSGPASPKL